MNDTEELRSARHDDMIGLAVAACFVIAALTIAVPAIQVPAHVDRLTVDNPHRWMVTVDVSDADADSWVGVGTVERERDQTFDSILDQGAEWTIRFTYAGVHVDLQTTDTRLERQGWRVTVPDRLADELSAADVPETPR
jgi:hypothetical protein